MTLPPAEHKLRVAGNFDRAAPTYDTVIPFFGTFAEHLVDAVAPQPGDRVLDVACGRGACVQAALHRVGPSGYVAGVDLAPAMVDAARRDVAGLDQPPGMVEVFVGDAEHLDFPDASFDVVVSGFGVFFFPDLLAALAEVRRVLRPAGRFAASTFANGTGGYSWTQDVVRAIHPSRPPAAARNPVGTAAGLRDLLTSGDFVDVTTTQVAARFVFTDVDAFLAWSWSHGSRAFLESFSDDEADAFRAAASERLERHAVPGGHELVQLVDLTVAQRGS